MTTRKIQWRAKGENRSMGSPFGWLGGGPVTAEIDYVRDEIGPRCVTIINRYGMPRGWSIYIDGHLVGASLYDPNVEDNRAAARTKADEFFWKARDKWDAEAPARDATKTGKARKEMLRKRNAEKRERLRNAATDLYAAAVLVIEHVTDGNDLDDVEGDTQPLDFDDAAFKALVTAVKLAKEETP